MSNIKDNLERVFDHFYTGKTWYEKDDKFRLYINEDTVTWQIEYNHTVIAEVFEKNIDELDEYHTFLVVTMQNFKSDRTWNNARNKLIKYAEANNIFVIYVPQVDIGFGLIVRQPYEPIPEEDIFSNIIFMFDKRWPSRNICALAVWTTDDIQNIVGYAKDQDLYKAEDILTRV